VKQLELGVFLPIGNNGFMMSHAAPQYHPTFEHNRQIAVLAEEIGLDYVFSMSKWRGYGGDTEFWDHTLESVSLMIGLAAATRQIGLIATVNPLLFHPAAMAKIVATADDIAGGRFGLNLITGSAMEEYDQMGVVPEGYGARRYEYLSEWTTVLKRLWTEERVTHSGEFFHLEDCMSSPKPRQVPHPRLVCAGTSGEGLGFTAREADYSFLGGNTVQMVKDASHRAKELAVASGRRLKTATVINVVQRETRAEAEDYFAHLQAHADMHAIESIAATFGRQGRESSTVRAQRAEIDGVRISYAGRPVVGDADDVADAVTDLAVQGDLDSVLLVFPDYLDGLRRFDDGVLPMLRREFDVGLPVTSATAP
jgi:pyrimidine oxygenase